MSMQKILSGVVDIFNPLVFNVSLTAHKTLSVEKIPQR